MWVDPIGRISGHLPTDNIWFAWLLAHGAYSVENLSNPLFSDRMNVPDGVNMMANTSVLGVSILLSPITLWLGPQIAYNTYLTLALAASAGSCYYVFSRHLVKSRVAAWIGGAFFGFAPGIVHHANGQPNFVSNFLLPFIVLRVFLLRQPGRVVRNGVILGLLVTWQVFINEELLLLAALACVAAVGVYVVMRPAEARKVVKPFIAAGLIGVSVALSLLAYPLAFQFFGPQSYSGIPHAFSDWGEDLMAYFTFARDTLAGDAYVEKNIGRSEQNSWFGIPLVVILLLIVVLTWRRSLVARVTVILAMLFAVFAVGPVVRIDLRVTPISGPWRLFDGLPLVSYMIPSRLVYVVVACVAVLLAVATDLLRQLSIPSSPMTFRGMWYVALAIALVPIVPMPLPVTTAPTVPAFITAGTWRQFVADDYTLVSVPTPSNTYGLKALLWQAVARHEYKMPRGYFLGPDTTGRGMYGAPTEPTQAVIDKVAKTGQVPVITDTMRQEARNDLRRWRAAVLVLDVGDKHEFALRETVTQLTDVQPVLMDGAWVWDVRAIVTGTEQ